VRPKHKKQEKVLKHGLGDVAWRELGIELDKEHQKDDWGGETTLEMLEYAAKDSQVLPPLVDPLEAKVQEDTLDQILALERRVTPAMVWMAAAGVPIDEGGWEAYRERNKTEVAKAMERLNDIAPDRPGGELWNWNSWQQIVRAFELLGHWLPDTTKETLSECDHPLAEALLAYRNAKKRLDTCHQWLSQAREGGFTPLGGRWVLRQAGCPARSPISRTCTRWTRCAASSGPPRGGCSSRPTTRRWSSGSSPSSQGTQP
jgi:DNA polymerase I-like protein with 3'-5' exonuclease and polymerase domains